MKKLRKLIPAFAMLLLSAILMTTASYAWFSMNNKVTVTGMEVKTKVSNNLLIAPMELTDTAAPADQNYKTSLTTTVKGFLEPVSTVDGKAFFYTKTTNVGGTGDALNNEYIAYDDSAAATDANYANAFSQNYGVTTTDAAGYTGTKAIGYVDYIFALKAQNTGSSVNYVNLTSIGLTYAGTDTTEKAFRVAVFVEDMGTSTSSIPPTSGVGSNAAVTILAPTDAVNFTSGQAVNSTTTTGTVTYGSASTLGSVNAGETHYYKVVVRLWLEGEDNTCNNTTFAALNDKWILDLTVELNSTDNGNVTVLGKNSGVKTNLLVGTGVTSNTIAIDGVTYYEINGVTVGSAKIYKTANAAVAASDRIFKIVENHPVDVTNQINFTNS